jgi:hypothetical protein
MLSHNIRCQSLSDMVPYPRRVETSTGELVDDTTMEAMVLMCY